MLSAAIQAKRRGRERPKMPQAKTHRPQKENEDQLGALELYDDPANDKELENRIVEEIVKSLRLYNTPKNSYLDSIAEILEKSYIKNITVEIKENLAIKDPSAYALQKTDLLSEIININCMPTGVEMMKGTPKRSNGIIESWNQVGRYLHHAMQRAAT